VLTGNLFDNAIMKTSVISKEFRDRYLSDPEHPNVFSGRAIVFDGPEDYHDRIDDPALEIDDDCLLFVRGAGPLGYPGSAEVVNMQPPAALIKRGVHELPCIGDGRQSGTSGSPSILNASPEAAAGGGLALLRTGDPVRIDLVAGTVDVLLPERSSTSAAGRSRQPAATRCPRRRRRGRRSSAAWSTSSATAWSCAPPSPTSASPGPAASRATATELRPLRSTTAPEDEMHARRLLADLGLPGRDAYDLPTSDGRFPDGGQYRVEIPSVEGPEALAVVLEEAGRRGVPVHRVSQGSGIMMQTDDEVREMLKLGEGSGVEVCLFTGPRASWDVGVQAGTPSGRVSAGSLRGADQLGYAVEDVLRGCELGLRSILVADLGALMVLGRLKRAGRAAGGPGPEGLDLAARRQPGHGPRPRGPGRHHAEPPRRPPAAGHRRDPAGRRRAAGRLRRGADDFGGPVGTTRSPSWYGLPLRCTSSSPSATRLDLPQRRPPAGHRARHGGGTGARAEIGLGLLRRHYPEAVVSPSGAAEAQ
jgi:hypothetical protein